MEPDRRGPAERIITRDLDESTGLGRPLRAAGLRGSRTVEGYLKGADRPRWMERVVEVDRGIAAERRRLAHAHATLRAELADEPEAFARRWRAYAEAQRFDDLNELIREHNTWYPIERDLPMDLRTRDYVLVSGRDFRRPRLDAAWVLEHFPA